jgi:hypothetical protein
MAEPVGAIFTVLLFIAAFVGSGAYAVLSMADFRAARRGFWATTISFADIGLVLGTMTTWPLSVRVAVCAAFMAVAGGGLIWILDYLKVRETLGIESTQTETAPNIAFQKFALFWVKTGPTQYDYQLGIVTKLFNLDNKPYLLNGMGYTNGNWQLVPRAPFHLRTFAQYPNHAEIIEDNYIKAGNEGYFKSILPLVLGMDLHGGPTPEAVIVAQWFLTFGKNAIHVTPELYSVYEAPLSPDEWSDLLKPKSQINMENLRYKPLPKPAP